MPDCTSEQGTLDAAYADMETALEKCDDAYLLWKIEELLYADCDAQWKHEMFETDMPVDQVIECGVPFGAMLNAEIAWLAACDEAFSERMRAGSAYAALKDCQNGHKFRNITIWDARSPR